MRTSKRIRFLILGVFLFSAVQSFAKNKSKKSVAQSKLTTDAKFTGARVNGLYAHSPEGIVTAEKEKKMILVIKPRENFHFQIEKSIESLK
ncbi:MAG: hypothetical protein KDD50_00270 [Bdellovibrionales bacterium]|nr:hypothetical protein [Bdellovibrionales bacterium]